MAEQPPVELSERELEILKLVVTGATNQQIAQQLIISVNTVKAHLRNIFGKLGVESRTEATLYAIQHNLVNVGQSTALAQPTGAEDVPAVPAPPAPAAPRSIEWPFSSVQAAVLGLSLLLALALAIWPSVTANPLPGSNPLIDQPVGAGAQVDVTPSQRWESKTQMPTPRGRFAQAFVDGHIYVIAGLSERGWSGEVEVYDTTEDLWERRAAKPLAVANVGAAVVDGLVYVPGGLAEGNQLTDVMEVYDPANDRWSAAAPLPQPLCAYAIAPYEDGFYLFGGWDGERYLATVYYYDATSDSWREEVPLRTARGFAAAATVSDRIYLLGGYDGNAEYSLCESYTPALAREGGDPWRNHAAMSASRAGHAVAVSQGSLYVVGGGWENSYLAYNERYDMANDAWSTFESPIVGQWRALGISTVASREGNFLYAIGGWNKQYLGVVQAYQAFYRLFIP
jgi:DNA-binding CsgD family transcriptional regulator/N-acetylneuraminic acid mutarotase